MTTLYSLTIYADLALLAIVIAIFFFAVTIYRAVLELSTKEEENALSRRKDLINAKKGDLLRRIAGPDDTAFVEQFKEELNKLDVEIRNVDQSISKAKDKAKALTLQNLVAIPGLFLIMSMILSGIALATIGSVATIVWIVSLVLLVGGVYFIYRKLSMVELFSMSIDLSTLMEQALERHRMKSVPVVEINIPDFQFEIPRGQKREILYLVSLKQGLIARNARVRFSGTEELEFPGQEIEQLGIDYDDMKNPKEFWQGFQDVNPKMYRKGKFEVEVPNKLGEYTMAYWLQCDEWTADQVTFKIRVT